MFCFNIRTRAALILSGQQTAVLANHYGDGIRPLQGQYPCLDIFFVL